MITKHSKLTEDIHNMIWLHKPNHQYWEILVAYNRWVQEWLMFALDLYNKYYSNENK